MLSVGEVGKGLCICVGWKGIVHLCRLERDVTCFVQVSNLVMCLCRLVRYVMQHVYVRRVPLFSLSP